MKNRRLCEAIKGKLLRKLHKYDFLDIGVDVVKEAIDDEEFLSINISGDLWRYEVGYNYDEKETTVGLTMNDFFTLSSSEIRKYVFYFGQLSQALDYLTGISWEYFIESTERSLS